MSFKVFQGWSFICLSVCLDVCPSVCVPWCLCVRLSLCLDVCVTVCLCVCPNVLVTISVHYFCYRFWSNLIDVWEWMVSIFHKEWISNNFTTTSFLFFLDVSLLNSSDDRSLVTALLYELLLFIDTHKLCLMIMTTMTFFVSWN